MKWTSIRVDVASAERLERYRVGLERAVKDGRCPHPTEEGATRVSLGQALSGLLNGKDSHARRCKRQAAKRRKTPPPLPTDAPTAIDAAPEA